MANGATLDIAAGSPEEVNALSGGTGATVILGANLVDAGASSTFAGTIEGAGSLTVSGVTLTLTGDNSFTGGAYVADGGQLVVTASGSIVGSVTNDGEAVFNGIDTRTVSNAMTGTGSLYQFGTGMLTLDGNQSGFTGTTYVESGGVQVGDVTDPGTVLGGDVQVDGGVLGGHGTIDGTVTNNSGTLSPGSAGSIGILTVGGYQQMAGGNLNIQVTPSTVAGVGYDQLSVTGAAA